MFVLLTVMKIKSSLKTIVPGPKNQVQNIVINE